MNWGLWFRAASIRAVKTASQTFIASIGTATIFSEINWSVVLGTTSLSTVLSFATSLAGLPEVTSGNDNNGLA